MLFSISGPIQPGEDSSQEQRETWGRATRTTQDLAPLAAVEDRRTSQASDTRTARREKEKNKKGVEKKKGGKEGKKKMKKIEIKTLNIDP